MDPGNIPSRVEEILSLKVLGRRLACSCGREHQIHTRQVVIEPGVAQRLPELLADLVSAERLLLVADRRTYQAAGEQLAAVLRHRFSVDTCVLQDPPDGHIHASVELADEILAAHPKAYDLLVAVGAGTINDLTKEMAHRREMPYVVMATAASMNGYTSAIVALLDRGLKTTRPATPPVAVFADPQVLAAAPRELTLAGLGDLVSKPYCGCDWWIAALVKDEYHCPLPDRLLAEPFAELLQVFPRLGPDDPEAVVLLLRLLLVSGLSMAVAGTSSPASGAEHLLSHHWDMSRLRDGEPVNLHGAQVGVASLVIDALYRRVLECDFADARFQASPDLEEAEQEINALFGSLAPVVWPQWRAKLAERSEQDLERLVTHQTAINERIRATLATGRRVRHALTAAGAPVRAAQLGINNHDLASAVLNGRMIRTRFTALDVAAELGLLQPFAAELAHHGGEEP